MNGLGRRLFCRSRGVNPNLAQSWQDGLRTSLDDANATGRRSFNPTGGTPLADRRGRAGAPVGGDMNSSLIVGSLAALASTVSFVPQAWKIIRMRRTDEISVGMYALTVAGFALWTTYGVMLASWPLVVPNAICLVLAAFILAMSLLPQGEKEAVADFLEPGKSADAGGREAR